MDFYKNRGLNLPQSVIEKAELPLTEDIVLHALETYLPDVPAFSLIPEDPPPVFINVRKDHPFEAPRHTWTDIIWSRFTVDTFTVGPNGDLEGALLQEAVRVALREAWVNNHEVPGLAWVNHITMIGEASRVPDWATSAGPVQYADLPTGTWRYESTYLLKARRYGSTTKL